MNPAPSHDLQRRAAFWLLRLPFLGVGELACLLNTEEHLAASLLAQLSALGWVEWFVPQSPELEAERVFYLTEQACCALATELGMTAEQLSESYAVGRREMLLRVLAGRDSSRPKQDAGGTLGRPGSRR